MDQFVMEHTAVAILVAIFVVLGIAILLACIMMGLHACWFALRYRARSWLVRRRHGVKSARVHRGPW